MTIQSRHQQSVGYLEMIRGSAAGFRLPFAIGVTFIGRHAGVCEPSLRARLRGVVEAAQIYLKTDGVRHFVADATSTNQTTLIRGRSAAAYLAGDRAEHSDDIIPIRYESLGTAHGDRRWVRVLDGDLLSHIYGVWRVVCPEREATRKDMGTE